MTIYGIEIDSMALVFHQTDLKLIKIRESLRLAKRKRAMTLRELQSLLGHLNFACLIVVPSRIFYAVL